MTTYALPLSEGLASRLSSLSQEKVNAVHEEIAELISEFLEDEEPNRAGYPLTPDDVASIREGLLDSDLGRVHDGDEVLAELRKVCGRA